jgi:serine/threonine protein kinase
MPERYEFIRKIAQGGFGHVYLAKDKLLGREVAIKRLLSPEESASYEQARSTFAREATTLAAMQHPNIVQIYDFDRDDEGTYVVMEMLEGETLKDRLNRGPLTWDTFVNVTRQALDAINAAHSKGILHRDLKPENLFLNRTPSGTRVLKILDFGLAKLSSAPSRQTMDQAGNDFGSIYYMAPEQFLREPLDGRTDLYALGCVFYQALTAKFPFDGGNMQATMEAHMEHEVKPIRERRPDLSSTVSNWLMRLISFSAADRPPDAVTALREFEAALEGRTLQPPPKSPSGPVSSPPANTPRHPARMAGRPTTRPGTPPTARPTGQGSGSPSGSGPPPGAMRTPMQTRASSALEASRADARAKLEAAAKRRWLAIKYGVPAAVVALVVIFLSARGGPKSAPPPPAAAAHEVAATKPKGKRLPAPSAAGPGANAKSPPVPAPKAPPAAAQAVKSPADVPPLPEVAKLALPSEASLIWRFRAGADSRHKNAEGKFQGGKLQRGQTVHFWKNLASADKAAGLIPYEDKSERAPAAQAGDVNGPGTGHTLLYFSTTAGMEMKSKPADAAPPPAATSLEPPGVTVAAIFRAYAGSSEVKMRPLLLTSSRAKHSFSLHFNHHAGQYWAMAEHDGQSAQSLVKPEEFAKRKEGADGSWVAAVGTWDAKQGAVTLRVRSPDGKTTVGPASPIPPGMAPLDVVNIGFVNVPKDSKLDAKEVFDGSIIEIAVYGQVLDAETQDKLLGAVWDRYFKKRS